MNFKQLFVVALIYFSFVFPFTLFADPVIVVNPNEIEADFNTGDEDDFVINITNEGDDDLHFTVRTELIDQPGNDSGFRAVRRTNEDTKTGPRRDELGDVITEFNFDRAAWSGMAWDGELMHGIRYDRGQMVSLDPLAGEIVESIEMNRQCFGLVYQEPFFWTTSFNEDGLTVLMRFNRNGNILETVPLPGVSTFGVASDGENVYFVTTLPRENRIVLRQITFGNNLIREIDCQNLFQTSQVTLEWVEQHDQGHLWALEWNRGTMSQVDISGDQPELIQRTEVIRSQSYGLAHDGVNLWFSTMQGNWTVIDDGVSELAWLTYDVDNGILREDEDMDLIVTLNAEGLIEGGYEAAIHFLSNDPENPDVVVNVVMTVTGVPILDVSWSEEIGFPDRINWNVEYIDLFAGGPYPVRVNIFNSGTADLVIESILCANEVFTSAPDNLILAPQEGREVEFIFNADAVGDYEENMVIVWNSPDGEDFEIRLNANADNPPAIAVEPLAIEEDFADGEVAEHIITVSNEGDAVLRFTVDIEVISEPEAMLSNRQAREVEELQRAPYRDELGDVIEQYNVGRGNWTGLAWDGELVWGINSEQMQVVGFDPGAGEMVANFNVQGQLYGLAYDGQSFWAGTFGINRNASLIQFDRNGNITRTLQVQGMIVTGVAFDGENLWYYSIDEQQRNVIFRQITLNGELLRQVDCTELLQSFINSITYVPEHEDGNLWVFSWDNGTLYQLNIDGQRPHIAEQTRLDPSEGFGITHDGVDLWYCQPGDSWFKIDDGVSEHHWIMTDVDEGEIGPGEDMDIGVFLNAEGLIGGMYEADIHILSNDPDDPDVVVSVVAEVTGVPRIEAEWSREFGYPDRIDWNLAFEDLFTGVQYPVTVEIINVGTDVLLVEEISCVSEVYIADQGDFVLRPGETLEVNFILSTEENGRYESEMTILSNDPDNGELAIPLLAVTAGPPEIELNINAIEADIAVGETEEYVINITNDGESTLRFSIDHEVIEEPDRDSNIRHNPRSATGNTSGPQRDDFGEVLAEYRLNLEGIVDIAWDGQFLWCLNENQSTLSAFNPETEEIVRTIRLDGIYNSLDCAGDFFWVGGMGNGNRMASASRIDLNGNLIQTVFVDGFVVVGISYDGENLWINSNNLNREVLIKQITTNGDLLREVNCQNILPAPDFCLEYVPEHENGHIWIADWSRASLTQLDVSNNFAEIVQQTEINRAERYGITHDGENLWYSTMDGVVRVIDDGIDVETWLTYEPDEGEIEPDGDMDIFLTLNATDLELRDYEADVQISSNDPENPIVVVNVIMRVEPNSVPDSDNEPVSFSLSSAYPNPFNSTTRIEYTVPEITTVNVNVYDITGQLVKTLFSGSKPIGTHYAILDGKEIATGVYLISLESQNFNAVRKVTLMK